MAAILRAAEELFGERGFDSVATKEIAERAEVGEATLFRYITSKDDLLLLIVGGKMDEMVERVRAADAAAAQQPQTTASVLGRVHAVYKSRADLFQADPGNVTSYLWHGFRPDSKLGAHSIEQGDMVIAIVRNILEGAAARGLLREGTDARLVAMNCNALYIHEVLRTSVRGSENVPLWDRLRPRLDAQLLPTLADAHGR
jgi:AcrR family transcriptional regulator